MNNPDDVFTPDKFILLKNVPLLDEHTLPRGPSGKTTVTADDLEEIADNNNQRWKETQDATAVCIGHTVEGEPETEQPPLVGWAVNFKTGPFFETGRSALYADFYIKKEHSEAIEKYPRRSVEYWVSKKQVDPISLLSSSTPERDLGILRYHRETNDPVYQYALNPNSLSNSPPTLGTTNPMPDTNAMPTPTPDPKADGDTEKIVQMVLSSKPMVELLSTVQQFKALLDELENEGGAEGQQDSDLEPVDDADADMDDDKGESDKPKPKKDEGADDKEQRSLNEKPPVKFNANATNCYTPDAETKTKMSRENNDAALKYQRELDSFKVEMEKKYKEQAVKYQRLKAEKSVAELEGEGVDFTDKANRDRELDLMSNLSDAAFDTHVKRIKLNYKRKGPDSEGVTKALQYSRTANDSPKGLQSNEDALKLADIMMKNPGLSYEDALGKMK